MDIRVQEQGLIQGEFVEIGGERYYGIRNVDRMAPFFISVISNDDHWLFVSSSGGLTAGRVSPETALFPYVPVDRIHESVPHTGSTTLVRFGIGNGTRLWEPFNRAQDGRHKISRNLYKNVLGNKLCFEEINHDLQLAFRYTWMTSAEFGFVRRSQLENLGDSAATVEVVDGLQNLLPAGTPMATQSVASNLVDAYKWTEVDRATGLAFLTLYAGITDRAEPCESLRATTAFSLGFEKGQVLISNTQLNAFRRGEDIREETLKRGVRGAYLLSGTVELAPRSERVWRIVVNAEQSQKQVVDLRCRLGDPDELGQALDRSVAAGSDELARIVAGGDGFQVTAEENVSVHHYANVLFNILRGGIFDDQYGISTADFRATIRHFNRDIFDRNQSFLEGLPKVLPLGRLLGTVRDRGDPQLARLACEYLPITFGRRHGDPSRPWNRFAIRLKDDTGRRLLSYQGNWRDIFQNWEALTFSYPGFVENVIAKFVNASTMDGYNPYRITKAGIDWEIEDPDDPWSYIGYWGDHQIIYLLKLLELSGQFHPDRLRGLLRERIFSYANVPYRIRPFDALLKNGKETVDFDPDEAERIAQRVQALGADGKLVLDGSGQVYQVNLLEKLLVPLLAKLGNLVVDGGIWLNTQRPEWNDANNALVGHGLSMVTLYYLRRYLRFLQALLARESGAFSLSEEVRDWLIETADALQAARPLLGDGAISAEDRFRILSDLGRSAGRYRDKVYAESRLSGRVELPVDRIMAMLKDALAAVDHSISTNRRDDGLYHAYNLLDVREDSLAVDTLYPMLEGQVAVLSSGAIDPEQCAAVVDSLFASPVYRPDQSSFMLYPDRELPGFLDKNRIDPERVDSIPVLKRMLAEGDERIILRDADGVCRFNARFCSAGDLDEAMERIADEYGDELACARDAMRDLYEQVFNHKAFTGRSGTMFGFEGLGSIYWHMVSKLLLAVQENFFAAEEAGADPTTCHRLGELYYRVRAGIGFNKSPKEYGAFPTDPYSHSPKHAGARQPGMTGQVKEEVLTRFGELGVRVVDGVVRFRPTLLRAREFVDRKRNLCYLDVDRRWQDLEVPAGALAFTWCQVPVIYRLDDAAESALEIIRADGTRDRQDRLELSREDGLEIFERGGGIRQLIVTLPNDRLFSG